MASASQSFWTGKVVLVTGASSGLGLAIAQAYAVQGAHVVLCARDADKLKTAAARVTANGGRVLPLPADVTQDESVAPLMAQVIAEFGQLDVLVNNVGLSTRQPVTQTGVAEMQAMLDVNFLSVVRCTQAALPHLLRSRGQIVNIGSLASKVGTRFLGAYPASKHALAAYSQQLRLELVEAGVSVLLVCPGPIARDEARTYNAEADANLPASAARPGGGAKIKALDPHKLAAKIVSASQRRKPEIVIPGKARLLFAIAQLFPALGDRLLRKLTR